MRVLRCLGVGSLRTQDKGKEGEALGFLKLEIRWEFRPEHKL
jgi:hypothetical protein